MKPIKSLLIGATLLSSSVLGAQPSASNPAAELWNDPAFVKSFVGSYGFLAGYEPGLSDEEKEALRSLIDLIKVRPSVAIQQLEPQITESSSASFDFILANLYFQQGNLPKAEQFYNNAIAKYPDFRRAYQNLGLVQVQNGNFESAIDTISKALELGVVSGRLYGLLGYGYLTQKLYYPSEAAYRQAILLQPSNQDWKVGLAQCLLETQRYSDAIALFDSLLKEDPDNSKFWLLQSNAYLGKGDSLAAAKNLELVRRMNAAELSSLTLLGDIYMNNEMPELALDAYLSATEQATAEDTDALLRAADLFVRTGNYEEAKKMIERTRAALAPEITEDTELKLLTLDAKIARAEGDDEAAVTALNDIVARDTLNGEALIELADFYADKGDIAKATIRYEQAANIEAYERPALLAHAKALVRATEYKKAVPLLQRVLQIKSDNNIQEYLNRVEKAARNQK